MSSTYVVAIKICGMFLVMLVGWLARRRAYIDARTTATLSTFTTDVALPSLIFTQMLSTVDARTLRESWAVPLLAAAVLVVGQIVGWAGWRLFATRRQAPTFIFVVAICNWIYLPLPIVSDLYKAEGIRVLLLCNIGVQVVLWTMGVATLRGGKVDIRSLAGLLRNPGLIATLAGIVVALTMPVGTPSHAMSQVPTDLWGIGRMGGTAIFEAMVMIGSLTIPLSLLVTGAQMGAIPLAGSVPGRAVTGVMLLRLIVVPLVFIGALWLAIRAGCPVPRLPLAVTFLIAAMPVAVSCSILAERFGQDTPLAAQSIFYSTLLSIVTVPAVFAVFNWLMG